MITINDLPNELLLCVFDKLTLKDKARVSQVSSRFNTLINATYRGQLHFEFPEFQDCVWPLHLDLKKAKLVLKKLNRARIANVQGVRTFDRADAKLLIECCPDLRHINLSKAYVKPGALIDLVKGCHRIDTLILNGCELDDDELSIALNICCDRLRQFEIDGFPENGPAVSRISSELSFQKLNMMSISNCGLFYVDYRYSSLFQNNLTELQCSILEEPRRTVDLLVNACPKLRSLTLDIVEPNGDLTMERECCFALLSRLTQLERLTLDGAVDYVADLNDANLLKLIQNCPKLETLEIGPQSATLCGKILTLLSKFTPHMSCLRLTRLKIEPDDFRCLANLPLLTKACFDHCQMTDLITDSLLIGKVIRDCVRLNELSLLNMNPTMDEDFWIEQLAQYRHLERKQFDFCLIRDSTADNMLTLPMDDTEDYDMFHELELYTMNSDEILRRD